MWMLYNRPEVIIVNHNIRIPLKCTKYLVQESLYAYFVHYIEELSIQFDFFISTTITIKHNNISEAYLQLCLKM